MNEFKSFLKEIEKIVEIYRIIPWRISRQQKWTSNKFISFSYYTTTWLKYNLKKWWTAQEVFIVCKKENKETVNKQISLII
jgi:hypothetical protein